MIIVPKGITVADGEEALNKGSIYSRKGSPEEVLKAYKEQFGRDFTVFLKCRSKELVEGGRLVLTIIGTHDEEVSPTVEIIGQVLYKLAYQGWIEKKKVDGFNLPMYAPNIQLVKHLIEAEGSFDIHMLDVFDLLFSAALGTNKAEGDTKPDDIDLLKDAKFITSSIRRIIEPLLASEFGEGIMDQVFGLFEG